MVQSSRLKKLPVGAPLLVHQPYKKSEKVDSNLHLLIKRWLWCSCIRTGKYSNQLSPNRSSLWLGGSLINFLGLVIIFHTRLKRNKRLQLWDVQIVPTSFDLVNQVKRIFLEWQKVEQFAETFVTLQLGWSWCSHKQQNLSHGVSKKSPEKTDVFLSRFFGQIKHVACRRAIQSRLFASNYYQFNAQDI